MALQHVGPFDKRKGYFNAVVETPKGSCVKYAYDTESGLLQLKRALPSGMVFPFNFGFIPSTLGEDGDPLDILILNEEPLMPGCLLKVRLSGIIEAKQRDGKKTIRNDRLIGVAIPKETPPEFTGVCLDKEKIAQIEQFFVSCGEFSGNKFRVLKESGAGKAKEAVKKGIRAFQKHKG